MVSDRNASSLLVVDLCFLEARYFFPADLFLHVSLFSDGIVVASSFILLVLLERRSIELKEYRVVYHRVVVTCVNLIAEVQFHLV